MHSRYKQVSQEEKKDDEEETVKKQRTERMDRITAKIHVSTHSAIILITVYRPCFGLRYP